MRLKIAIAVNGRFYAFDLALALLRRGHDVVVFTNYPAWAAARFQLPERAIRSLPLQGTLARLRAGIPLVVPLPVLHRWFGRWAARELSGRSWDSVYTWSEVSEEILSALRGQTPTLLERGSAHIRAQAQLLEQEQVRAGVPLDRPSPWIIDRQEREYSLADRIVVPSEFAKTSFMAHGVPPGRVSVLPLGTQVDRFRPASEAVAARCERILAGRPLRVLYVGTLSFRKGLLDIAAILRAVRRDEFRFRFVGPIAAEAGAMVKGLRGLAEFIPKQPEATLPVQYAWGDVFLFPTIEDGFAQVLAQACAGALPILATTNCAGPDLIEQCKAGWVLPIRSPDVFVDRLRWCHAHREALAATVMRLHREYRPRDWDDVAVDFERLTLAVRN